MTDRENRIISDLIKSIRGLREQIESIQKDQQSNRESRYKDPLEVRVAAGPNLDPARSEYYNSENAQRKRFWVKHKAKFEVTGIFIAALLAALNWRVLSEIQKQTPEIARSARAAEDAAKLNRELAEGTQAANLNFAIRSDSARHPDDSDTIIVYQAGAISWANSGQTAAINLDASLRLEVSFLSSNKPPKSKAIPFHRDRVSAFRQSGSAGEEPFTIDDWTTLEPLFDQWRATATITGTYSYDDGFGRKISGATCYQWRLITMLMRPQ